MPIAMPLTPTQSKTFAARWYAAWNAHDIDAIMSCYDPSIRHSSPFIKKYNASDALYLEGLPAVRDYFARALERNPTLRFDPQTISTGLESVILTYRRHSHTTPPRGELSAEVFFLNDDLKIVRSVSHYGES
ncbi:MAG TPA: nuclear transport factor 2 family protein [Phycisphaerales bacterium]|nr:nuclear transport factor 2 family protein [Phycisphaerales bacterium]